MSRTATSRELASELWDAMQPSMFPDTAQGLEFVADLIRAFHTPSEAAEIGRRMTESLAEWCGDTYCRQCAANRVLTRLEGRGPWSDDLACPVCDGPGPADPEENEHMWRHLAREAVTR